MTYLKIITREERLRYWIKMQGKLWSNGKHKMALICNRIIYKKYHCDISPSATVPESTVFPHPVGVVIGAGVIIGEHVRVYQCVTIGGKKNVGENIFQYPIVEDNVIIYPNSCVIGAVVLGENSVIGAGSVVLKNVEKGAIYAGNPAHRLK